MNAQIIALSNQKGGVTKSTTCVNLGIGLAKAGKKVLMMDNALHQPGLSAAGQATLSRSPI